MYDFLVDLDEYFCEKYANYDRLCALTGYKMPVMHATKIDQYGRSYSYTLPSNRMALAGQEKKTELLALLKEKLADKTFSFSFRTLGLFRRLKNKFSKYAFYKTLRGVLNKYGVSKEEAFEQLSISEEIWTGIWKGKYLPSKNLLFSLALTAQISLEDISVLMRMCDEGWDFAIPKDVVISYLLTNKVYNAGMVQAALQEYKVENLFIKNA